MALLRSMSISGHIKIHIVDTMLVKYAIYLKNKKNSLYMTGNRK